MGTTSENALALSQAEAAISDLKAANAALIDRADDLENRSRRASLRIVNVPEGIERGTDMVEFAADLLKEIMGDQPGIVRGPVVARGPCSAQVWPRPVVVCFHRYQEKERSLRWARQHQMQHKGKPLRIYPDLSAGLSKKRAAFKNIKAALYEGGIQFRLLYPARRRVSYEGENHNFDMPGDAEVFFQRIIKATSTTLNEALN
ncbi:hypothetical protein AOLI_G00097330 [Acnodon oligacanthus]